MYLTRATRFALKLSLNHTHDGHIVRRAIGDRGTVGSAVVLAAVGLSMSIFSLKQMFSSKVPKTTIDRIREM